MRSAIPILLRKISTGICLTLFFNLAHALEDAQTQKPDSSDQDAYLPHASHAGMWMFEYRYMRMFQNGMLRGSDAIDPQAVLQNPDFRKLPYNGSMDCDDSLDRCYLTNSGYRMNMDMHMLMMMYHQTKDLSWMVMLNYLSNNMSMYDKMDQSSTASSFDMKSNGIGDIQIFLTNKMTETEWFDIKYTLGINLPVGSIDAPDGVANMQGKQGIAPYDMQLGSGTYDIITALDIDGSYYRLEYGAQAYRINRTGMNHQYYNLGDSLRLKAWSRYTFPFGTQLRGGVTQSVWSPIEGRDMRMSDNTQYYGGKRLDLVVGVGQKYKDYGIYIDYGYPLLQYLNGVQMKTTGILYFGLQYMYM